MDELRPEHSSEQWRRFVDSSEVNLKAVLLQHRNKSPSISLAHAVHMNETYENLQDLLQKKSAMKNPAEYMC